MSWKYKAPLRMDYDSDEEYEAALEIYDTAYDDYAESYIEDVLLNG